MKRPGKIICVGLNYRDHAEEAGLAVPAQPLLFAKWPNAVIGNAEAVMIPSFADEVDYEAELGLVVGRRARDLHPADALGCIAGATCVNDISARRIQFGDGQWTRGKSFDTFCPVGPRVVPLQTVGPLSNLTIRCLLNGDVVQDSSTRHMIFPPEEIIAYASRGTTLEPGDLIATGTPAGVGLARTPARFLQDGDEVTVEIERVGRLTSRVRAIPVGS